MKILIFRCLHLWIPHEGRSISSLFFLDDHKNLTQETQLWRYAVSGCDQNRELKVWSCTNWSCLQIIRYYKSCFLLFYFFRFFKFSIFIYWFCVSFNTTITYSQSFNWFKLTLSCTFWYKSKCKNLFYVEKQNNLTFYLVYVCINDLSRCRK